MSIELHPWSHEVVVGLSVELGQAAAAAADGDEEEEGGGGREGEPGPCAAAQQRQHGDRDRLT